jgi:serine/threonine protein kinase
MNAERWQQVKQIYNAALDLDAGQRKAFLDDACADDEPLRTEVERLLASRSEAGDLLERPAIEVAAEALARDRALSQSENLIGQTVSHFRIVEEIGAGGMGVVYRAWDERLERDTAVKFLPEIFAADPDRLARLEREARILASVSHPNIAAIYGLEVDGDRRFLVMEYVAGETLGERLARGSLPLDDALEICRQIAEGVEAAHEKGVIHRDLKPANVKITPDGQVKVLDFGLAKGLAAEPSPVDGSPSPATPGADTHPGMILGTAAYMSPEQAKGRRLDKRADVWAFGCILYECLTGKRAFPGDSAAETLAAVLTGEPDWTALRHEARTRVQAVLQRCLQKDPRRRYRDIADAWLDIEESARSTSDAASALRRPSIRWLAAGVVVTLAAGTIVGVGLTWYSRPGPPASVVTSTIKVEPGLWLDGFREAGQFERPSRTAMAFSSDGRFLVYSAVAEHPGPDTKPRLHPRRMDRAQAQPIGGTEGGISPFLSPDNRWVGFWVDGKLKKIPVEGGVPTTLCETSPYLYGANWGGDNSIVFADGWWGGLSRVSADGGKPETLTRPDPKREEASHRLPYWLPNGRAVLFTVMRLFHDPAPSLALLRLDTREWHVLLLNGADARYVPTGHLVFMRQGTIMAVRFDPARLEVIGQPFPLVENVSQAFSPDGIFHTCAGQFAISAAGSLIYAAGGVVPPAVNSLVWVDQNGAEQPATALTFPFIAPRLSPDGQRVAYYAPGRE